jgi:hypothetical protein
MLETAASVFGKTIRLTDERWAHITEEHPEVAGYRWHVLDAIRSPDKIVAGNEGELIAAKEVEPLKDIVVVYREFDEDGFVITSFLTRRRASLARRQQLWP